MLQLIILLVLFYEQAACEMGTKMVKVFFDHSNLAM